MIYEEMKIARCVEYEAMSEEPLMLGQEASIEMPGGKIKDLPPPPKPQAEVSKSQYRRAFEHSQRVELDGLMEVGCFRVSGPEGHSSQTQNSQSGFIPTRAMSTVTPLRLNPE